MSAQPALVLIAALAVLFTAGPSEAQKGLLREGSRPPLFILPDGAGRPVALKSYLGPRRILLLFNPAPAYLKALQAERRELAERDLTALAIVPPDSPLTKTGIAGPALVLWDAGDTVAQKYGATHSESAFYLIGKDGHIAVAQRDYTANRELFAVIDAMPMRRREMRERRG